MRLLQCCCSCCIPAHPPYTDSQFLTQVPRFPPSLSILFSKAKKTFRCRCNVNKARIFRFNVLFPWLPTDGVITDRLWQRGREFERRRKTTAVRLPALEQLLQSAPHCSLGTQGPPLNLNTSCSQPISGAALVSPTTGCHAPSTNR